MDKTKLYYDIADFVKYKLEPKFSVLLGRPQVPLTGDVLVPQIMVTYGVLEDNRVLITFHVSTEDGKEEELKEIIDKLSIMIEQESNASKFYIYDYGRTRVLHPAIDGKPFLQKLCHFAGRPR